VRHLVVVDGGVQVGVAGGPAAPEAL
jgi:hypothetical protein